MHILIPLVSSRYSVLTNFGYELFEALTRIGCQVSLYIESDGTEKSIISDIEQIVNNKGITHIVSFNGALLDLFENSTFSKVIFISWMVDYPAYHYPRLNSGFSRSYVICSNDDHRFFIDEVTTSKFLGVLIPGASSPSGHASELESRMFDVAIAGSWMGAPDSFWLKMEDDLEREIIQKIIDELIENDKLDVYTTVKRALLVNRVIFRNNAAVFTKLINRINDYLRKYSRLKMMSALAVSGLKCLIIGEGWEKDFNFSNFHFHPSADYKSMPLIYENARIAINLNSNSGACERALQSLASGCHVFSFHGKPMQLIADLGNPVGFESSALTVHQIAAALNNYLTHKVLNQTNYSSPSKVRGWDEVAQHLVRQLQTTR